MDRRITRRYLKSLGSGNGFSAPRWTLAIKLLINGRGNARNPHLTNWLQKTFPLADRAAALRDLVERRPNRRDTFSSEYLLSGLFLQCFGETAIRLSFLCT